MPDADRERAGNLTRRQLTAVALRCGGLLALFETVAYAIGLAGREVPLGAEDDPFAVLGIAARLAFGLAVAALLLLQSRYYAARLVPVDLPCAPGQEARVRRFLLLGLMAYFLATTAAAAVPLARTAASRILLKGEDGFEYLMRAHLWEMISAMFRLLVSCVLWLGLIEGTPEPSVPAPPAPPATPRGWEGPAPLDPR